MVLSLSESEELRFDPVPELEVLRTEHTSFRDLHLRPDTDLDLEISADSLEIRMKFEWQDAEEVGLKLRCSPDGEEETLVRFNTNPGTRPGPAQEAM